MAASELAASGVAPGLRRVFLREGGKILTDTVLLAWDGAHAKLKFQPTGDVDEVAFAGLVLATIADPETELADSLSSHDIPFALIGDAVAPRRANMAIYEGLRVGLAV